MANFATNNPGALIPRIDPRQPHYDMLHEIVGGETESRDWREHLPPFKWQSWYPFCTAFTARAIIHAINKAFDYKSPEISPAHLFFASGGGKSGNTIIAPFLYAKDHGAILERFKPMPSAGDFTYNTWDNKLKPYCLDVSDEAIQQSAEQKVEGVSWVPGNDRAAAIDAMEYSPLSVAIPVHEGYFTAMSGWKERKDPSWHNVPVSKIHNDGTITVFDSLTVKAGFDGYHDLPEDYPRSFYLSVRDLPTGWQDHQQQTLEQMFPAAYHQYGQPRLSLTVEQIRAQQVRALIESPEQDPRIRTLAGKYWIVLVNAALYGGFSYYVTQNGKKYFSFRDQGSDLANCLYSMLRTGKFPLDLNKLRSQQ